MAPSLGAPEGRPAGYVAQHPLGAVGSAQPWTPVTLPPQEASCHLPGPNPQPGDGDLLESGVPNLPSPPPRHLLNPPALHVLRTETVAWWQKDLLVGNASLPETLPRHLGTKLFSSIVNWPRDNLFLSTY